MPSTSKKQHNFMEAVANNPAFAKKAGVPQSVGKDFAEADKGKKFGSGGSQTRADRQAINQPKTDHGAEALFKKGGSMASKMNPGFMAMMAKKKAGAKAEMPMKKGGAPMKKMAAGGLSSGHKSANGVASKGKTKGMQVSMPGNKGMKSGGSAKKYC
jgi:hypothetical protein